MGNNLFELLFSPQDRPTRTVQPRDEVPQFSLLEGSSLLTERGKRKSDSAILASLSSAAELKMGDAFTEAAEILWENYGGEKSINKLKLQSILFTIKNLDIFCDKLESENLIDIKGLGKLLKDIDNKHIKPEEALPQLERIKKNLVTISSKLKLKFKIQFNDKFNWASGDKPSAEQIRSFLEAMTGAGEIPFVIKLGPKDEGLTNFIKKDSINWNPYLRSTVAVSKAKYPNIFSSLPGGALTSSFIDGSKEFSEMVSSNLALLLLAIDLQAKLLVQTDMFDVNLGQTFSNQLTAAEEPDHLWRQLHNVRNIIAAKMKETDAKFQGLRDNVAMRSIGEMPEEEFLKKYPDEKRQQILSTVRQAQKDFFNLFLKNLKSTTFSRDLLHGISGLYDSKSGLKKKERASSERLLYTLQEILKAQKIMDKNGNIDKSKLGEDNTEALVNMTVAAKSFADLEQVINGNINSALNDQMLGTLILIALVYAPEAYTTYIERTLSYTFNSLIKVSKATQQIWSLYTDKTSTELLLAWITNGINTGSTGMLTDTIFYLNLDWDVTATIKKYLSFLDPEDKKFLMTMGKGQDGIPIPLSIKNIQGKIAIDSETKVGTDVGAKDVSLASFNPRLSELVLDYVCGGLPSGSNVAVCSFPTYLALTYNLCASGKLEKALLDPKNPFPGAKAKTVKGKPAPKKEAEEGDGEKPAKGDPALFRAQVAWLLQKINLRVSVDKGAITTFGSKELSTAKKALNDPTFVTALYQLLENYTIWSMKQKLSIPAVVVFKAPDGNQIFSDFSVVGTFFDKATSKSAGIYPALTFDGISPNMRDVVTSGKGPEEQRQLLFQARRRLIEKVMTDGSLPPATFFDRKTGDSLVTGGSTGALLKAPLLNRFYKKSAMKKLAFTSQQLSDCLLGLLGQVGQECPDFTGPLTSGDTIETMASDIAQAVGEESGMSKAESEKVASAAAKTAKSKLKTGRK